MTLFIPKTLKALADLTAESGRYALAGIRVIDPGNGGYRLEATDGRRLLIAHGTSVAPTAGAKETFASLEAVANSGIEAIISADDWRKAMRMGPKRFPAIGLVMNPDCITCAAGAETLSAKPLDGRFPDVNRVLPKTPPILRFCVDPKMLAGLLVAMAAIEPEGGITLLWYGPDKPLGLMAKNATQQLFLDALLMPLS